MQAAPVIAAVEVIEVAGTVLKMLCFLVVRMVMIMLMIMMWIMMLIRMRIVMRREEAVEDQMWPVPKPTSSFLVRLRLCPPPSVSVLRCRS